VVQFAAPEASVVPSDGADQQAGANGVDTGGPGGDAPVAVSDMRACCVQQPPFDGTPYVVLERQEARDMRRMGLTVVRASSGDAFLGCRTHDGAGGRPACVAFQGQVGGACACSIYAARPGACRRFAVGERHCRQACARAGLPV
jgi:hypothetical protein